MPDEIPKQIQSMKVYTVRENHTHKAKLTSVDGTAGPTIFVHRLVGCMGDDPLAIQADTVLASLFLAGCEAAR